MTAEVHTGLESDWTIKNDIPRFGLKEHTAVDSRQGFVLATTLTPASVHDTNFLAYCTAFSRHTKQKIKKVYAEKTSSTPGSGRRLSTLPEV